MSRRALLLVVGALSLLSRSGIAQARPTTGADSSTRSLRALQQQLEAIRRERLELESQAEKQVAVGIAERTTTLQMSSEAGSLQRLERLLDSAETRLRVQRDRIRLLNDAARLSEAAMLVVLLRGDSLPAGDVSVQVTVDGAAERTIRIDAAQSRSVRAGAAVELFRRATVPDAHAVTVALTTRSGAITERTTLRTAARQVVYVEFAWREGRLIPTSWSSAGTTPF
ncbi:MAG: hypothetical protein K2X99_02230 [Gemmatimonadaceae bacterium]|nr:hypothetical protein [Gemmatimonadaceae bacterium]